MTKFVALLSGKGGVGKTTATLNLGVALKYYGRDVAIVDANITMPNIALHLGSTNLPVYFNHVLKNQKNILESIYRHPSGVKVIPASINYQDVEGSSLKNLKAKLSDLNNNTEITLIDCPPGIGKDVLHVLKAVDQAIVVANPDIVSVTDALRTVHFAEENGVTVLGVLLNKVRGDAHEMSVDNIESIIEKPVLAQIKHDDKVREAINAKHPVVFAFPDSKASSNFKELAAKLIGTVYVEPIEEKEEVQPTFFEKMLSMLGLK